MFTSIRSLARHLAGTSIASVVIATLAAAIQTPPPSCAPGWRATFGNVPGLDQEPSAFTVFDDGSGPALYAGGGFRIAGGGVANRVARWDGATWSALGDGLDGSVLALTSFDDGTGLALYAGGSFTTASGATVNHVAKWDGTSWSPLGAGTGGPVRALRVFDDGTGPALYAGGEFQTAGGLAARNVAKWDGTSWSPLAGGIGTMFQTGRVHALEVFDDGGGPALFAAGYFFSPGSCIAKWNGSSWSMLAGGGLDTEVDGLAAHDDGTGNALYVGGWFTTAGGAPAARVAKWNGVSWSPLGTGMSNLGGGARVHGLASYDDGGGSALYACGVFSSAGGTSAKYLAKWNGSSWAALSGETNSYQVSIVVHDDGTGAQLYVGGGFSEAGNQFASRIARWNGATWSAVGRAGLLDRVYDATVADDGSGPTLFVTGEMRDVPGSFTSGHVAKWNGSGWSFLGSGLDLAGATLLGFDDGTGPALYVGGYFTSAGGVTANRTAKWNGTTWSSLGTGTNAPVFSLSSFDEGSGPRLFVGGAFTTAGGVSASHVARWNGSSWSALSTGVDGDVHAMTSFDDGTGGALYVGGAFTTAGGVSASSIAKWNGTSWSALGSGVSGGVVDALIVFDDGTGPALYAGGTFTTAGGASANGIAKWNGSTWSAMGSGIGIFGVNLGVYALAAFDDGSGPTLYAGGQFTDLGGQPTNSIARWSGTSWDPIDASPASEWTSGFPVIAVNSLTVFDAGQGPGLCVGGIFERSPAGDAYLAQWANPCTSGWAYCFGDGSATACPCGNASNPNDQAGCVHSLGLAGRLTASGIGSLTHDTIVLSGSGMTNGTALYFQGSSAVNGGAGVTFGDGLRCAGGTTTRLGVRTNVGGASHLPTGGPTLSTVGLVSSPSTRTYQIWYRDSGTFCTSATFATSNGWSIHWVP